MFGRKKEQATPDLEYFTIYDTKVGTYRTPMPAVNAEDMVRQIDNMMRDPSQAQNQLLINAEDFQLHKIGAFSFGDGILLGHPPEHVANLHEIRTAALKKREQLATLIQQLPADRALNPT